MAYKKTLNKVTYDFNNSMDGNMKYGFPDGMLRSYYNERGREAYDTVMENRGKGMEAWTDLPYDKDGVLPDILETAKRIRKDSEAFVVLGIGGSSLGPAALIKALCHPFFNELPKGVRKAPRIYFAENVDPVSFGGLLDVINPAKTTFNVITKSGNTSETMSQYLIISGMLKDRLGEDWSKRVVATTSRGHGNLAAIAEREGLKTFFIPEGVGGRFSVLSPVGLLPAAVAGIKVRDLLDGAAYMDARCQYKSFPTNPALVAACVQVLSDSLGNNVSVMMPYADALRGVASWYCQLWGESLGKALNTDGEEVHEGQTPVAVTGVTDQHSQLQLYMEGPFDKHITFISVGRFASDITIPESGEASLSFLGGSTLGTLLNTERVATEYALTKGGRFNCTINLPEINPFTIGQLLYFFEMQTAFAGALLEVNPFDQPGVEFGKNATYGLFGRPGYEKIREEVLSAPEKRNRYIV